MNGKLRAINEAFCLSFFAVLARSDLRSVFGVISAAVFAIALVGQPASAGQNTLAELKFHVQYNPFRVRRTLNFPRDYSLGELFLSPTAALPVDRDLIGAARGTIIVPPGKFVTFVPAHRFYQAPEIIDTLPADGIDRLFLNSCAMDDAEEKFCDNVLARISHLSGLLVLNLDRSSVTDIGAAHAKDLPALQYLSAYGTLLNGSFIKQLVGHKTLRNLSLQETALTEQNMKFFALVPHLEHINIEHCNVADAGLKNLIGCKNLLNLQLADNPKITDRSIPTVLTFKNLRMITLSGTGMTNAGAMQLKKLPLRAIVMPVPVYDRKEQEKIRLAMPGISVSYTMRKRNKPVDAEVEKLYAPLH